MSEQTTPNNPATQTPSGSGEASTLSTLLSDGFRNNEEHSGFLSKFGGKGAEDLANSYVNLERMTGGKLDGYVKVPGEGASAEEIAAFHQATGVPEAADQYELPTLEDGEFDQTRIESFLPVAHKLNLNKDQVQGLIQFEFARQQAEDAAYQEQFKTFYPDDTALQAATDAGSRVLARIGETEPELADELKTYLGKDLHFTRAMETLSKFFKEAQTPNPKDVIQQNAAAKRAEEIEKKLNDENLPKQEREALRNELASLYFQGSETKTETIQL